VYCRRILLLLTKLENVRYSRQFSSFSDNYRCFAENENYLFDDYRCFGENVDFNHDDNHVGNKHVSFLRKYTSIDRHINKDSEQYRLDSLVISNSYKVEPPRTIFNIYWSNTIWSTVAVVIASAFQRDQRVN